jgi:hypothetical protein
VVAGSEAAVAAVVAAVAAVAIADGIKEADMWIILRNAAAGSLAALLLALPCRAADTAQQTFPSAEDAVSALVQALHSDDVAALAHVLGQGSEKLVESGDPVADANGRHHFLEMYDAGHKLVPAGADRIVLDVGEDNWPMPIPIVRDGDHWRFDSQQGAQEIVDRRIGRNEIDTIRTLLALVDAQRAFKDANGHYAQHVISTEGQHDGLYWPAEADGPESPLAPLLNDAEEEGYPGELVHGKPFPYHGYYYRLLKAQGRSAPNGAADYVKDGKLAGGFAFIAWPATFGASGIMTFLVNQDGVVFQKDLGPQTASRAAAMTLFDPDLSWARIDVSDQ